MADRIAAQVALRDSRVAEHTARLRRVLPPLGGTERVLDLGCGAGQLAYALAPHVREVVGVDDDAELLVAAREGAPANCTFQEGDLAALPFGFGEFDIAACALLLHRVRRPELVAAELARVTHARGTVLVVDHIGSIDPLVSMEQDRFERAIDPAHRRLLSDADLRGLFDQNNLVVTANEVTSEERDLGLYLDAAGRDDDEKERVLRMAPGPRYSVEIAWYVGRKPG